MITGSQKNSFAIYYDGCLYNFVFYVFIRFLGQQSLWKLLTFLKIILSG
jgi:hypothetical protein